MSKTMTRKYNKKTGAERIEKFYPNGQLKMSGDFKNGIPVGEIKEYAENGIMTGHHNLTNDSTAFYKEWLPTGVKILDCLFVDKKTEKSVRFFPDGSLESIEHFVDKKLHGLCVYYFAGNPEKVKIRANFENDERHGIFEEYYANGNIKVRSQWNRGRQIGVPEAWTEDGKVHKGVIIQKVENTGYVINL